MIVLIINISSRESFKEPLLSINQVHLWFRDIKIYLLLSMISRTGIGYMGSHQEIMTYLPYICKSKIEKISNTI